MTHLDLCIRAEKWLRKHDENILVPNCKIIARELVTISQETPDIVGWGSNLSVLIEVKASRSDFLKDWKKRSRMNPDEGIGQYRYYFCEENVIRENDLPDEYWGLIYLRENNSIKIAVPAKKRNSNLLAERTVLLSIIRRNL